MIFRHWLALLLIRLNAQVRLTLEKVRARLLRRRKGLTLESGVRIAKGVKITVHEDAKLFIGASTYVAPYACFIVSKGTLSIGSHSFIGSRTIIVCHSSATIGEDALIAEDVKIASLQKGTSVGHNVWLGAKSRILDGSKIGANSVVAAGASFAAQCADGTLVIGEPARLIPLPQYD